MEYLAPNGPVALTQAPTMHDDELKCDSGLQMWRVHIFLSLDTFRYVCI